MLRLEANASPAFLMTMIRWANRVSNSFENGTFPVGTNPPDSLGLYDFYGNANIWVWDWYGMQAVREIRSVRNTVFAEQCAAETF